MSSAALRACAILALLACGVPVRAQSWDALRELRPGDQVKILDAAGNENKGAFAAFANDSVSVRSGRGSVVAVERARVHRVQVRSRSRRVRNALIGAAIGVAVGVAVDQTLGAYLRNETGESGRAVTYIAPIALFGAVAAAMPAYRTIYRAR